MILVDEMCGTGWRIEAAVLDGAEIADGLHIGIIHSTTWNDVDGYLEVYHWGCIGVGDSLTVRGVSPVLVDWARDEIGVDVSYGHNSKVFTMMAAVSS